MSTPSSDDPQGIPVVASGVALRHARREDIGFARTLYFTTMMPLLDKLGLGDEAALEARFARSYKQRRSRIARLNDRDVGWIQVSESVSAFHLDQLHLVSGWCGYGIGSHLLQQLIDRAQAAGSTVALDVLRGNPAIQLYRRFGFYVIEEDREKFKMLWRPDQAFSGS